MTRRHAVPRAVPAAGCGGTGPELARFGDLTELDGVLIGPVGAPPGPGRVTTPPRLRPVPGGVVHAQASVLAAEQVAGHQLPWLRARGVKVTVAVRGRSGGELADHASRLRRSLDFEAVAGVEIDLRGEPSADPQVCLKLLARLRESLPRDLPLTAKLGPECPDLVAAARAAVAGGAVALVLAGAVPAYPEGRWLAGPAVLPVTEGLLQRLTDAIAQGRVPDVPLVAGGGVHDEASALRLRGLGAAGVQLGTALLADPGLLWRVHAALAAAEGTQDEERTRTTTSGGARW
jgi:dihydroorotate dehydrogenase (NAD+) catalytic subunit